MKFFLVLFIFCSTILAQSSILPLSVGNKWTLKNAGTNQPIVIEVLGRNGSGFHIRFSSPFGTNDWVLEARGSQYFMTKYGANSQFMDLPGDTLYFDFERPQGTEWKNTIGKIRILQKDSQRVLIRQESKGGKLVFGFENNKGFVQFGEGKSAFVLSEQDSNISVSNTSTRSAPVNPARSSNSDSEPVAHIPAPAGIPTPTRSSRGQQGITPTRARSASQGKVLFSITPNTFANESSSPTNLIQRFNMVTQAGMTFLVHNAKWDELEPRNGIYDLEGLNFNIVTAKKLNIPVAYTFRLIETVDRSMPKDLAKLKWSDPKLENRLLKTLEVIIPQFKGQVRWFMLGNEIDGYFTRHPDEIEDFAKIFSIAKKKIKELDPSIQVSSTLMYGGIRTLDGALQPLNQQYDFLCFTYYPIRADFTMKEPSIVGHDLGIMREYAKGRKIVLQEVGYPSGNINQSNIEKQAQFVRNIFQELRANSDIVDAACFWLLADLKDDFVRNLSRFYGVNADTFKSFLQTLGMFDAKGQPKPAWEVYRAEIKR